MNQINQKVTKETGGLKVPVNASGDTLTKHRTGVVRRFTFWLLVFIVALCFTPQRSAGPNTGNQKFVPEIF
jgi:hypothetical protein